MTLKITLPSGGDSNAGKSMYLTITLVRKDGKWEWALRENGFTVDSGTDSFFVKAALEAFACQQVYEYKYRSAKPPQTEPK